MQYIGVAKCPMCSDKLSYEAIEQLSMDLINGICHTCEGCKEELSLTVHVEINCLGKDESGLDEEE